MDGPPRRGALKVKGPHINDALDYVWSFFLASESMEFGFKSSPSWTLYVSSSGAKASKSFRFAVRTFNEHWRCVPSHLGNVFAVMATDFLALTLVKTADVQFPRENKCLKSSCRLDFKIERQECERPAAI